MRLSNGALTLGIIGVVWGSLQAMGSITSLIMMRYLPQLFALFPSIQRELPAIYTQPYIVPLMTIVLITEILIILSAIGFLNNSHWGRIGFLVCLSANTLLALVYMALYLQSLAASDTPSPYWGQFLSGNISLFIVIGVQVVLMVFLLHPAVKKQFNNKSGGAQRMEPFHTG